MAGKEMKARGRTVQKMSREGLTEENLRTGEHRRVSHRTQDTLSMKEGEISTDADLIRQENTESGTAEGKLKEGRRRMRHERQEISEGKDPASFVSEKDDAGDGKGPTGAEHGATAQDGPEEGGRDALRRKQKKQQAMKFQKEAEGPEGAYGQGSRTDGTKAAGTEEAQEEADAEKMPGTGEGTGPEAASGRAEQSVRMQQLRGRPSSLTESAEDTGSLMHGRKLSRRYSAEEAAKRQRLSDTAVPDEGLEDMKEELISRQKKERLNRETRKKAGKEAAKKGGRLAFDDEGEGMARGSGMGICRKAAAGAALAAGAAAAAARRKVAEADDGNVSVEAAKDTELVSEESVRRMSNRLSKKSSRRARATRRKADSPGVDRLLFSEEEKAAGKNAKKAAEKAAEGSAKKEAVKKQQMKKFYQKQRYKRIYANAKLEKKKTEEAVRTSQNIVTKAVAAVKEAFRRNSGVLIAVGIIGLFILLIAASLSSCTAAVQGAGSSVVGTTYAATDEEIYAVENAYCNLETDLNTQINQMESTHSEYEDYRYQIDEISHNPYQLASYFTVKYGEYTYAQVKDELEEIFKEQYSLETKGEQTTVTETKRVRVGESLGEVVTSGYCNCSICCGKWAGGATASGAYPTAEHTIAVDASNPFVPMGTHVIMNGIEYVVEDTGAFAKYGVQFDVYYGDHASASAHGHQTWEAYIADDNGTEEVEVTTTEEVNRLSVAVSNHNLDTVLRARMTDDEIAHYELYNKTYGNRDYLFDTGTLSTYGYINKYEIPPEALTDVKFANMITEAEKYLGYKYVWGGDNPSDSFDCSGFVCWVINNCGNGWNVGRTTAEGLRQKCAYVDPAEAKPGDIVFFQGTYETAGASHLGIYVGNGMMIHCGDPIQYTSINTSYWQQHFMMFGRLR